MADAIDSKLLNQICTIKSKDHYIAGKILKIYQDKFAVKLTENVEIAKNVEILIETLDNVIYFYVALTEAQHVLDDERIIMFKPISDVFENNKRSYPRFKIDTYFKMGFKVACRQFPPKNVSWIRGELIDISQGGLRIYSPKLISQSELLEVQVSEPFLPQNKFTICRVEHVHNDESGYHISCEFININEEDRNHIEKFIEYATDYVKDKLK